MSEENTTFDDVEKVFKEVCELASDECNDAIDRYKEHGDALKMTVEVFDAIRKCKSEKCTANKMEIVSRLNDFLVRHRG